MQFGGQKKTTSQKPFKNSGKTSKSALVRKKPPPDQNTVDAETVKTLRKTSFSRNTTSGGNGPSAASHLAGTGSYAKQPL